MYTHVPCIQAYKVLDRITGHIEECNVPMTFELDPMYKIPELKDTLYTFGWAIIIDGLWHLEFNASMRIHQRIMQPVFGDDFATLFGRKTPKAIQNFLKATDHHRGNFVL